MSASSMSSPRSYEFSLRRIAGAEAAVLLRTSIDDARHSDRHAGGVFHPASDDMVGVCLEADRLGRGGFVVLLAHGMG